MVSHADKPELRVDTVAEWEGWLESAPDPGGVRLRLRKTAAAVPGITYAEALDVALCFGWIDGQKQSLDADYFLQAFTPRRPRSIWSKVNIGHVARLIEEGRMRPAGQHEIDRAKADGRWDAAYRQRDGDLPAELQDALDADPPGRCRLRGAVRAEPVRDVLPRGESQAPGVTCCPRRPVRRDAQAGRVDPLTRPSMASPSPPRTPGQPLPPADTHRLRAIVDIYRQGQKDELMALSSSDTARAVAIAAVEA